MPYPTKKQRLEGHPSAVVAANDDAMASFDDLSDVLPNVLGFLLLEDIMRSRRVNKKTMEAVRKTIVPPNDFRVNSMESYNAMRVMTEAMPNLQQIKLGALGYEHGHKFSDGEDPDEEVAAVFANFTSLDIEIISNFSKLRILGLYNAGLNGRYPVLFNSFPLLQKLDLIHCIHLKWDLEMLAGLPLLRELDCRRNDCLTGNINSLRLLKDTLEKVNIRWCDYVEGDFMDLADFPHLKELDLHSTAVTGDIRDIGDNDFSFFSSLEELALPKGVYGGMGYEFQHITDAPEIARAVYLLNKQRPALIDIQYWFAKLSEDSPDWYETPVQAFDDPPFEIQFVKAGSRIGYRWTTDCQRSRSCEVNWLDPEPDRESVGYADYVAEMQGIDLFFGGFHQPPTEEEYVQEERFAGQERALARSLRLVEELRRQREN